MTNNSHKDQFTFTQWFIARSDRIKNANGYTFRWNYMTCTFKITLFSAPRKNENTSWSPLSLSRSSVIKFHCCVTSDVWYGQKADAITKRLLIKQTKLQLTYLRISVLTLNKFKPGIQAYISLQEWQTTVTRGVYIHSAIHCKVEEQNKSRSTLSLYSISLE